jgi:Sigma-70, region 4
VPRPNSAPRVDAADRDARALELRRAGLNYREIAQQMGVSVATAHKYVTRGLDRTRREPADALRDLELERLDALQLALTQVLASQHVTVSGGKVIRDEHGQPLRDDGPTIAAAQALVRVQESRRRLLGLDAPVKVDAKLMTIDQIDARIAELEAELDAHDRAEGRNPYQRKHQQAGKLVEDLAGQAGVDYHERRQVHEQVLGFWQRWKDNGRALHDVEGFVADALATAVAVMTLPPEQAEVLASRVERFLLERAR